MIAIIPPTIPNYIFTGKLSFPRQERREGGESNLIQTRLKQIRIQFLRRSIRDRLG